MVENNSKNIRVFFTGTALGICIYFLVYGFANINVLYDDFIFIDGRDIPQHYLGWVFFRMADWTHNVGMFNTLTYPNFISLIYTDSIPIIECFFKLISPVLPSTFQYFGVWGMLCFALQGGISALVLEYYTEDKTGQYIGIIIMLLSTPILTKLFYHHALGSQFIILLGIWYWLYSFDTKNKGRVKRDIICWAAIGVLTAGIHIYFLPMLGMIVLGQAVNIWLEDHEMWKHSLAIVFSYIAGAALLIALLGGFTNDFQMDNNYVEEAINLLYRCGANLDAFVNSWGVSLIGNAYITAKDGQGEGLAYLGAGIILLLLFGIGSVIYERIRSGEAGQGQIIEKERNVFYAQVLIFVLSIIVAIGPVVSWHDKVLFEIPYPKILIRMWSVFRCEGRFIWVAYYIAILWIIKIFSTCNIKKNIKRGIFIICCIIQIIDLLPYIVNKHKLYGTYYTYETTLKDNAWNQLGKEFEHVVVIPNIVLTRGDQRYDIAQWAGSNGMTLNDFYLARQSMVDQSDDVEDKICDGEIDETTVYMFDRIELSNILKSDLHIYLVDGWYLGTKDDIGILIDRKEIEKQLLIENNQNRDFIYANENYKAVFDPYYYYYSYTDLWGKYQVNDIEGLFEHFISVGMKEGRRANDFFSPEYYKAKYTDLQDAFGENWEEYFKHYIEFGISEGRRGC